MPLEAASKGRSPQISRYIEEPHNTFLQLFPHRYDYIQAPHPQPGSTPSWQTERRYPLSDRLIEQGAQLYGVRFGAETNYVMLDIDRQSAYHPAKDRGESIRHIIAALEPLGIVQAIPLCSSYRKGIHLYLPFARAQKCRSLAIAIQALLEHAGFKVAAGQLELFPDVKPFIPHSKPQLYAAHRLPLQAGSYILNESWEPIYSSPDEFVRLWKFCQHRNTVTAKAIRQVSKLYQRKHYRISAKAGQFLNDLDAEIEMGWTSHGQTNRILGRIAMREYVFGHIRTKGTPLEGDDLVRRIVEVAVNLPGHTRWCRHQHEIYKRAAEWTRAVETSRYFHYGARSSTVSTIPNAGSSEDTTQTLSWNEKQQSGARERIRRAIAQMLDSNTLPSGATARYQALTKQHHISGATLYKHRDLWHPSKLRIEEIDATNQEDTALVENPSTPPQLNSAGAAIFKDYAPNAQSLLPAIGCNQPHSKSLGDDQQTLSAAGCNFSTEQLTIFQQVQSAALQEAIQNQNHIKQAQIQQYRARIRGYLQSDDPILVAEAIAYLRVNPRLLDEEGPEGD